MSEPRERWSEPPALPNALTSATARYSYARDLVGEAGAQVFRLHDAGYRPGLYLKHGRGSIADDVVSEMERLRWLAGRVPVPAIVEFHAAGEEAWLLTTAVPGLTAYQALQAGDAGARSEIAVALARELRRWHALPVAHCPFDSGVDQRLASARQRIAAGLVDTDDFDEARAGWSAQDVWAALHAIPRFGVDAVVTHGDYSLDNILLQDGQVAGVIDVGRTGVADRYQDLAIMSRCLREFDDELSQAFLSEYGIDAPDPDKLAFHLLLDELF